MAIRTYTATLLHPEGLASATIDLFFSQVNKYDRGSRIYVGDEAPEGETHIKFKGLKSWSVVEGGEEAREIEQTGKVPQEDEYHEYLILEFEDGTKKFYRNSYVTMFIR